MSGKTVVGPKGQILLPKAILEKYHFFEGDEIIFVPQEEGVLVKPKRKILTGKFRGKIDVEGFEKDIAQIHREWKL